MSKKFKVSLIVIALFTPIMILPFFRQCEIRRTEEKSMCAPICTPYSFIYKDDKGRCVCSVVGTKKAEAERETHDK